MDQPAIAAVPSTSGSLQPPQPKRTAIRDDAASGLALRESLFAGTLSAEAQHALMHMGSLRQGLIGRPVPHEVRKAVVTTPMNSNLRAVLLSEISLASSISMQVASPGQTTPGLGPHADSGTLKRKRGGGPGTDNSKGPYKSAEARDSAASETSTRTKRTGVSIASKLVSNLFTLSPKASSDPLQDGTEGAEGGDDSSTDDVYEPTVAEDVHNHPDPGAETTPVEEHDQHASENMITTASGRPCTEWHRSSSPFPDGVSTDANQRPHAAAAPAKSTWNIIHPHLGTVPYSPIPQKGHVQGLLPLPRKREIEFNSQSNKFFVSRPQDISAMIIQITGNEAPIACTRCRQGRGPFVGCVEVCASAPDEVKHWVKSCANCFYKGNQRCCDLPKLRSGGQSVVPAVLPRSNSSVGAETSSTEGAGRQLDGTSPPAGDDGPLCGIQARSHHTPISETRRLRHSSDALPRGRQPGSHETPAYETRQLRQRAPASPEQAQGRGHSTGPPFSVSNEEAGPAEDMVLEEWEIAPGRVRDATSAGIENMAFSSTYLTHPEEVAVSRDVGFNVLVVRGGSTHRWEAVTSKVRICSIAAGKVKVVMSDRDFEIGRSGMFRIKSDTSCTVENLYYGEATIHVCTMPDDYYF